MPLGCLWLFDLEVRVYDTPRRLSYRGPLVLFGLDSVVCWESLGWGWDGLYDDFSPVCFGGGRRIGEPAVPCDPKSATRGDPLTRGKGISGLR